MSLDIDRVRAGEVFSRKLKLVNPVKKPRYDKVYYEGVDWLNSLGSQPCMFDILDPDESYCLNWSCHKCSPR